MKTPGNRTYHIDVKATGSNFNCSSNYYKCVGFLEEMQTSELESECLSYATMDEKIQYQTNGVSLHVKQPKFIIDCSPDCYKCNTCLDELQTSNDWPRFTTANEEINYQANNTSLCNVETLDFSFDCSPDCYKCSAFLMKPQTSQVHCKWLSLTMEDEKKKYQTNNYLPRIKDPKATFNCSPDCYKCICLEELQTSYEGSAITATNKEMNYRARKTSSCNAETPAFNVNCSPNCYKCVAFLEDPQTSQVHCKWISLATMDKETLHSGRLPQCEEDGYKAMQQWCNKLLNDAMLLDQAQEPAA